MAEFPFQVTVRVETEADICIGYEAGRLLTLACPTALVGLALSHSFKCLVDLVGRGAAALGLMHCIVVGYRALYLVVVIKSSPNSERLTAPLSTV